MTPRAPRPLGAVPLFLSVFAACADATSPPAAYTLEIVDGDAQIGDLASRAERQLVVRVLNESHRPAAGVQVHWRVLEGGAGLSETVTLSDDSGLARARLTYGIEPGPVLVLAQVGSRSVTFRLGARRHWTSAGAGFAHSCALSTQGIAYCWGANQSAQLGDGTETSRSSPVPVFGGPVLAALAVGWFHTCALTGEGAVLCWGANDHGQLGLGDLGPRHRPARVAIGEAASDLSAGYLHTCAVGRSGAAYCWGSNAQSALGAASSSLCPGGACALTPVRLEMSASFAKVTAGEFHTCGVTREGAAYCWGWNSAGELGTGEVPGLTHPRPMRVQQTVPFVHIVAHSRHTCALSADGQAFCWGRSATGETGRPDYSWHPSLLPGGFQVRALSTGSLFTCALTTDERTVCFGDQSDQSVRLTPEVLTAPKFSQLGMGFAHSCGVAQGEVWCWGDNRRNQVSSAPGAGYIPAPTRVVFPE